tara:strand:- start:844 stop:1134 length:291 start_codon:yes stop_codon:yes gene_type:complete
MNPKRRPSKVVRVSTELFDELAEIGEKFNVSRRDVVDAVVEDYLITCRRRGSGMKFRVFQGFVSRMNLKMKKPPVKREPDEGSDGGKVSVVPDWMR